MHVDLHRDIAHRITTATAALLLSGSILGQPNEGEPIPLWPDAAPGALGSDPEDIPTLTPFLPAPDAATGAALVICPGGGYAHLADHEGAGYARYFSQHGIKAFVLKYRLGSDGYRHPTMLLDASRALRLVRSQASKWEIDPGRIGIVGSSAGGHLASTLMTHFDAGDPQAPDPVDRCGSRPDIGILCYPVISMGKLTHAGSRNQLLGPDPPLEWVALLSNETQVTSNTPPCFLWHTVEDQTVVVENSLEFAAALRRLNVPFELHLYEQGRHGLGLGENQGQGAQLLPWARECVRWLAERGWTH